jgi:hypothetical protein
MLPALSHKLKGTHASKIAARPRSHYTRQIGTKLLEVATDRQSVAIAATRRLG